MSFEQFRSIDLRAKLDSLGEDLEAWEALSVRGQPLASHHTQIRRLGRDLRSLRAVLERRVERAELEGTLLASAARLEWQLLAGHRVFGFYRGVFAMRQVAHLQPLLAAADDLAWACWNPAREAFLRVRGHDPDAADSVREPPLVYFGGDASPVEMSRGTRYYFDVNAEEDVVDLRDRVTAVIDELPIPMVSIPWFQLTHPPDLALIAHEVGHVLEDDFGLTERLTGLVDEALGRSRATAARRRAWHAWQGEVFADLYGCAAMGSGFAGVLMTFVALSKRAVGRERQEDPEWDSYPTTWLRAAIAWTALRIMGFSEASTRLERRWRESFPTHRLDEFEADVEPVVERVLEGSLPRLDGRTLRSIGGFDADREAAAVDAAAALRRGEEPEEAGVQELLASAGIAFLEKPALFSTPATRRRLLTVLGRMRDGQVREARDAVIGDGRPAVDVARGERLATLLDGE